jgi:hypothetical protein
MGCGLSQADDMKIVAWLCIGQMHNDSVEESQQINPLFAIVQTGIFLSGDRTIKNCFAPNKIQTMFAEVALPFVFFPSNHWRIVLTVTQQVNQNVNTASQVLRGSITQKEVAVSFCGVALE